MKDKMFLFGVGLLICLFLLVRVADAAPMMVEDTNTVTLHHEAVQVGRTINQERTLTYWTVTFSGFDAAGNYHGWREEVTVEGFGAPFVVIQMANRQLLDKLRGDDPLAHGFMRAVKHGQED